MPLVRLWRGRATQGIRLRFRHHAEVLEGKPYRVLRRRVFGAEAVATGPDHWPVQGLGLRLFDLGSERSICLRPGPADHRACPAGSRRAGNLRVGPAGPGDEGAPGQSVTFVQRRVDPVTLEVQASHEFAGSTDEPDWTAYEVRRLH